MTGDATSTVADAWGPVNTGSGHQNNYFGSVPWPRVGVRARRAVARDDQRRLLRRFVEPPNYNDAWETLTDNGCVLLTGTTGSGRQAAARMLLFRLRGPYVPMREVPDRPDTQDEPLLDASTVEPGDRLLLDLSATEEPYLQAVLRKLTSYRAEVRERGAHLVVVLRSGCERDFGWLAVAIERPDGLLVLRRYLRTERIEFAADQLDNLVPWLASAPIERIGELAMLVRVSRDRMTGTATFADWLRSAMTAVSDQDSDVAKQLRDLTDGRQRALLLASAMANGAAPDAVHHATATLLDVMRFPPDDRPALARPGLAAQLAEIGVGTDQRGRIRFDTLGYDHAVRTHFWANFPDLRTDFRDWTGTMIGLPALDGTDRDEMVARFAEQALRLDRPTDLVTLVTRWADAGLLPQAGKAMELGLADQRHGGVFRRQIYDWSVDRAITPNLAELVIRLCVDVLALTHPDQALVRLHHLARRQASPVGAEACAALLDLVDSDRRQLRRMLDRLAQKNSWAVDLDLFLALAQPDWLGSLLGSMRMQLAAGWRAVLTRRTEQSWAFAVRHWLSAAVSGEYREPLLDVLVTAGGHHAGVLSRLYVVARDWAREPDPDRDARGGVAAELADRIDAAQGIEP
jgi:hypothetical protein